MRSLHFVSDRILYSTCIRFVWISFILLGLFACKRAESLDAGHLYGKWDIVKAERNGRETNYLRKGYFVIQPDGHMTLNITGEEEKGTYVLENNRIVMQGEKVFEIESLKSDSMVIQYETNAQSRFVFYMSKKPPHAQ